MTMKLTVETRTKQADSLRTAGYIPGVVYGPKQEPINIAIERVALDKTIEAAGESTIVSLEGLEEPIEVLIHEVAFNPARGGVEHIDFYAIERGKELTTNVALEFTGEAPVLKSGASLNKVLYEVEVTCRPSNLPSHIDVDLSSIETVDAQIHVSDLVIPEGVTVNDDPESVVVTVNEARDETEDEEEAPEVDMDAIEVEEKGKEDSEETDSQ